MPDDVESYNNFEGVLSIYGGAPCTGCRSTEHNGSKASKDPWR